MRARAAVETCLSPEAVLTTARSLLLSRAAIVLMYHEVLGDPEDVNAWTVVHQSAFARQMEYVRRRLHPRSLDETIEILSRGDHRGSPITVTFDDGYAGNLIWALPVLEAFEIPATIYIATGGVASGTLYWYDEVILSLQQGGPGVLDLREHYLGCYVLPGAPAGEAHWTVIQRLLQDLKQLEPDRRAAMVQLIVDRMPRSDRSTLRPLTPAEVGTLARSKWITIGAHSHCHNRLCQLPTTAAAASIIECRTLLKGWTGTYPRHFSYPNGDYTPGLIEILRETGFISGVTVEHRAWTPRDSRYAGPRVGIGRHDTLNRFKSIASGVLV